MGGALLVAMRAMAVMAVKAKWRCGGGALAPFLSQGARVLPCIGPRRESPTLGEILSRATT